MEAAQINKHRLGGIGKKMAYVGKNRKCSSTTGSILISKTFEAAISTAMMSLRLGFTRDGTGKEMFYLYSQMVCFEQCLPISAALSAKMTCIFFLVGK